jgi:hypothetical protein
MPRAVKKEVVPVVIEESSEEDSSEEEMDDVHDEWNAHEDEVADMVDAIKAKLAQIDPGIGDRITLARFTRFVEANSTSL